MFLKGLLILSFITAFGLYGSSQTSFNDTLFFKYRAEKSTTQTSHIYFLIQLKKDAPQYVINKISNHALRKLSGTSYIIDTFLTRIYSDNFYVENIFPANSLWKLSPSAEKSMLIPVSKKLLNTYQILFTNVKFAEEFLQQHKIALLNKSVFFQQSQNIISLKCTAKEIEKLVLNNDNVTFIDMTAKPKEELGTPGYDLSANKLNVVHNEYPAITGSGQHVSIKENYYDTTDIDLKGRLEFSPLASAIVTNHANFIATIIGGAGNSAYNARGAAKDAIISSSSFEPVLPDADNVYVQNNITVQNHSYGTIIENNYGLAAMAFDKSANNNERLLHVFSSGNAGSSSSTSGPYAGIPGFANLTGNFKMAKNILTVGAVDSFGILAPLSSKGPAYDGRIKPELVAFQQNGTSEAAALVSGTTLLLQQYYRLQHPAELPASLAKAILLNTADDIYNTGPDFKTGFGNLNAIKAMDLIRNDKLFMGTVSSSATQTFMINIPANISMLKVTLVWNDIAASPLAYKALINDLDLEVTLPAGNISWKPWVLNSFPNIDSLNQPARRKRDSLNNVEQVTLANPAQGNYEIKISGYNIPSGSQKYYVAYSLDSLNFFKWYRPGNIDLVEAGSHSVLRWENSYPGNGDLEYKMVSSNTWQTIATNVDLHQNYIYWNVPDTISQAVLRMKTANQYYYSDTFVITTLLKPTTGYVCGDSILIYWNKLKNIHQYKVYQLGQKFMVPLFTVSDTVAVINKNILTDKYLAVAPILDNGIIATKSYAFNYDAQGAGCYINSFYVSRNGDVAQLNLSLGTVINIVEIDFERKTPAGYVSIGNLMVTSQLQYLKNYNPLTPGITYFRVKITLQNGQVIYSDPEAIFYAAPGNYVLLPVPVNRYSDITLITSLPDGEIISIIDILGRIVLRQTVISNQQRIKTSQLQSGEYFYFITKKGSRAATGKLLIL